MRRGIKIPRSLGGHKTRGVFEGHRGGQAGSSSGWISKKVPPKAQISSQSSGKSSLAASQFSAKKAAQAASTFLFLIPDHEDMAANLAYYTHVTFS